MTVSWIENLLRYHETGGHEGDGSDHALREARKELAKLNTRQQPSPSDGLAGELARLINSATDNDLSDGGRYFSETCTDLTRCNHGDVGEYIERADGKLVEWLWNHRAAILAAITAREAVVGEWRQALISAYQTGASEVHEHWVAGNYEKEPDFYEAAADYADSIAPVDVGPEVAKREADGKPYTDERFGDLTDPDTQPGTKAYGLRNGYDPGCP